MSDTSIHLEHVFITIRNAAKSLDFYRKLFPDWVVRWEGPTDDGGPDEAYTSLRIQHFGFAHPDVDTLITRLAKNGIVPKDRIDDGCFRRIYLTDPDGIELEFVEEL